VSVNLNLSVYQLASLNQQFDIILFLGVYYHLFAPFHALAQIRHCCHSDTIFLMEGPVAFAAEKYTKWNAPVPPHRVSKEILDSCNHQEFIRQAYIKYLKREPDKEGLDFYLAKLKKGEMTRESVMETLQNSEERKRVLVPDTVLLNFADHTCEWLPTMEALEQLLHATYFSIISISSNLPDIRPPQTSIKHSKHWRLRMVMEMLKKSRPDTLALPTSSSPSTLHRRQVFLKCAPFEGTNELHLYRPPFGLHRYDSRF
jgi:hypothetical protein